MKWDLSQDGKAVQHLKFIQKKQSTEWKGNLKDEENIYFANHVSAKKLIS